MKKFLILIILMLMSRAEAGSWSPELKIGILNGVEQVTLKVSAPCIMIDANSGETLTKIPADKKFIIRSSKINFKAIEIMPEEILLKDLVTTIEDKEYFGGVRLNKVGEKFTVINVVPIEEYLRGVVPEEMSPSYPLEALKAQAIAARSFALKNRGRHYTEDYDLCATTHCQVYAGVKSLATTDKAIAETRGEILTYKNTLINTNFHADSGGATENVIDVWGTGTPYLRTVKEKFKVEETWTAKFTAADFSSRFGESFGEVQSIKLSKLKVGKSSSDRTSSGRVKTAQIVGSKRTLNIKGLDLRRKFSLPSTLFDMELKNGEIIFTGFGSGHGVGMSQRGAKIYANDGWSCEKILTHYYHGTKVNKLY
ncbi:MAG: SpoIID/LytB domain-containing protein [Selenomonadaceae bacterium]|nr:SpoIID/LytB domain-containing protein [Selenomonadaceae bacterium]